MPDPFQPETLAFIVLIGMVAGTLGGLLGVGGSVVMIPALALLFGTGDNQHLYQASAMTANLAVALPAAVRHRRAGALCPSVLRWMLPIAVATIVLGVLLSNLPIFRDQAGGLWLGRVLAVFLIYVTVMNIQKLRQPKTNRDQESLDQARITPVRSGSVGTVMGTVAGLLGIGGGALAVPLQQALIKLPLRNAIANSSFVMVFSAGIGATLKLATLDQHYASAGSGWAAWQTALMLSTILAPSAIIGAGLGAKLTHTLPLTYVRTAFVLLMVAAAVKMAAIPL